jgi:hypothetical protein
MKRLLLSLSCILFSLSKSHVIPTKQIRRSRPAPLAPIEDDRETINEPESYSDRPLTPRPTDRLEGELIQDLEKLRTMQIGATALLLCPCCGEKCTIKKRVKQNGELTNQQDILGEAIAKKVNLLNINTRQPIVDYAYRFMIPAIVDKYVYEHTS